MISPIDRAVAQASTPFRVALYHTGAWMVWQPGCVYYAKNATEAKAIYVRNRDRWLKQASVDLTLANLARQAY